MTEFQVHPPDLPHRPLPVTIVRGMRVHEVCDGTAGVVVGLTQAYCVYQLADGDRLCVANWRDLALGNVCPAEPLLPADLTENDRRNARATVLRELLSLQQLGPLTPTQTTALAELVADLCGD